ncbi:MAG: hypothetical protein EBX37_14515 [Alphaproteobacteria bacterium]|nr:hypothetical protein [Alphaproteobacteria bacterium]
MYYYSDIHQSIGLLYGTITTTVNASTFKLESKLHGDYCIAKSPKGFWYEGKLVNNVRQGNGIMTFADGAFYSGEWKDGVKHGPGTFGIPHKQCVYEGNFVNDKLTYGKMTFAYKNTGGDIKKEVYIGDIKNFQLEGKGQMVYADGSVYDGEFKKSQRNGHGKLTHSYKFSFEDKPLISTYIGNWENDLQSGEGQVIVTDPDTKQIKFLYEGNFKDGVKQGDGVCVDYFGHVAESQYANNKVNGVGKLFNIKTQMYYEGEIKNGLKHGKGVYYSGSLTASPILIEGTFVNDKANGEVVLHTEDGSEFRGTMVNNRSEGYGVTKFANGWVFEGQYKDGQRYKGLLKMSEVEWYFGEFKDCKFHGQGTLSSVSGVYEGAFVDHCFHGQGKYTFIDGTVVEGEFVHNFHPELYNIPKSMGKHINKQLSTAREAINKQPVAKKPINKPGIANLSAKARRMMKQIKIRDNVQLVEKLIPNVPKGVKLPQLLQLIKTAKKLIDFKNN